MLALSCIFRSTFILNNFPNVLFRPKALFQLLREGSWERRTRGDRLYMEVCQLSTCGLIQSIDLIFSLDLLCQVARKKEGGLANLG